MSFKWAGWAWEQEVGPTVKLVLLALADTANDDGTCWPGVRYLIQKSGLSERTVRTALASLQEFGCLKSEMRFRHDGSQTSNLYVLVSVPTGAVVAPAGAADAPPGATDAPQEPIREPVIEPSSPPVASLRSATSPRGEKPKSSELQELEAHWKAEGLGPVSMNASGKLRGLLAAHGLELCKEGVTKAAAQRVSYPIAWMESAIPAWKRERGGGTGEKERKHKFVFIGLDGKEIT